MRTQSGIYRHHVKGRRTDVMTGKLRHPKHKTLYFLLVECVSLIDWNRTQWSFLCKLIVDDAIPSTMKPMQVFELCCKDCKEFENFQDYACQSAMTKQADRYCLY